MTFCCIRNKFLTRSRGLTALARLAGERWQVSKLDVNKFTFILFNFQFSANYLILPSCRAKNIKHFNWLLLVTSVASIKC